MKNAEMHALSALGAFVITTALVAPTVWLTEARAQEPPLRDMEVIEASLAYKPKNAPKVTQPQKVRETPPPEVKPEGVSRDENKKVEDKKPEDKKPEDKKDPKKQDKAATETDPLAKFRRSLDDEDAGSGPATLPAFDGSEYGIGDVTKGDPYFGRLVADLAWTAPELAKAGSTTPIGCIQLSADGKIPQTKFRQKGDGDLQPLAEASLRELQAKRNARPEQVPTHLLRALTTKWVCFEFKVRTSD
jgi:hypothetical protein